MTALTQDRNTSRRDGNQVEPPVAAATRIYVGALVAITAAGLAVPGATSTTLKCVGSALSPADNTLGAAGAIRVKVDKRPARFANSAAADAIAKAHRAEVDRKIADLRALRRELDSMIDQCRCGTVADCRIIEALSPQAQHRQR